MTPPPPLAVEDSHRHILSASMARPPTALMRLLWHRCTPHCTSSRAFARSCIPFALAGQDDPLTKTDHHIRKNGRFSTMNLSIYKLTQLPDEYSGLRDCLDRKVQTEKDRTRTLFHELDLEPGYYSLVPRVFDSSGIGYYVRVHAPAQSGVSIFRFSDGPSKALSVEQAKAAGEVCLSHLPVAQGGWTRRGSTGVQ